MSRQRRGSLSLSCGDDKGENTDQSGNSSKNKRSKKSSSVEPLETKDDTVSGISTGSEGSKDKKNKKSGFWSNLFKSKIPEKDEKEGMGSSSSFESVNSVATTNSFSFVSPKKYKGKGNKGKRIPIDDQSLPRGIGGPGSSATASKARSNGKGGTLNRIGMKIGLKKKYNLQSCESLENIWVSPSDRYARREACYGGAAGVDDSAPSPIEDAQTSVVDSSVVEPEPEASPEMSSGCDSSTWGTNTRKKKRAPAPPSKKHGVPSNLPTGSNNVIQVPGSSHGQNDEAAKNVVLKSVIRLGETDVEISSDNPGTGISFNEIGVGGGKKRESFPSGALKRNKSKDRMTRPCSCTSSIFAHHSKYHQHRRCGSCDSSHNIHVASFNTNSKTRTHVRGKKKAPPPPNPFGDPDAPEETNGAENIPKEERPNAKSKDEEKAESSSNVLKTQTENIKNPQNVTEMSENNQPSAQKSENGRIGKSEGDTHSNTAVTGTSTTPIMKETTTESKTPKPANASSVTVKTAATNTSCGKSSNLSNGESSKPPIKNTCTGESSKPASNVITGESSKPSVLNVSTGESSKPSNPNVTTGESSKPPIVNVTAGESSKPPIANVTTGESSKPPIVNVTSEQKLKSERNSEIKQSNVSKTSVVGAVPKGNIVNNVETKNQSTSTNPPSQSSLTTFPIKPHTAQPSNCSTASTSRPDELIPRTASNDSKNSTVDVQPKRTVETRDIIGYKRPTTSSTSGILTRTNPGVTIPIPVEEASRSSTIALSATSTVPVTSSQSTPIDYTEVSFPTTIETTHPQEIDDEIAQNILNDRQEQQLNQNQSNSMQNGMSSSETERSKSSSAVPPIPTGQMPESSLPSSSPATSPPPNSGKSGKIRLFNFSKEKSRSSKQQQVVSAENASSSNVTDRDIQDAQNTLEALLHSSGTLKAEAKKVDEQVKAQLGELKKESEKSPLLDFFGGKSKKSSSSSTTNNHEAGPSSSSVQAGSLSPTTPSSNLASSPEPSSPSQTAKATPRPWYKRSISSSKTPSGQKPKIGPKPTITMLTKFSDLDREAQRIVEENRRKSAEVAFNQNARELINMFSTNFPNSVESESVVAPEGTSANEANENRERLDNARAEGATNLVPSSKPETSVTSSNLSSSTSQGQVQRTIFDRPVSLQTTGISSTSTTTTVPSSYNPRLSTVSTNSYFSQHPRPLSTASAKPQLEEPKNNVAVVQPQKQTPSISSTSISSQTSNSISISTSRPFTAGVPTQLSTTNSVATPLLSASVSPSVRDTSQGLQTSPLPISSSISVPLSSSGSTSTSTPTTSANSILSYSTARSTIQSSTGTTTVTSSSAIVSSPSTNSTTSSTRSLTITTSSATPTVTNSTFSSYPKSTDPEWTCSRCTLKNVPWRALCEACYARKDPSTNSNSMTSILERVNSNKPSTTSSTTTPISSSNTTTSVTSSLNETTDGKKAMKTTNDSNIPSCENFLSQLPSKDNFTSKDGKLQGMKLKGNSTVNNINGNTSSPETSHSIEDPAMEELDIEKLRQARLAFFAKEQQQNIPTVIESRQPSQSQENSMSSKPNNLARCSVSSTPVSSSPSSVSILAKRKNNAKELNGFKANVFSDGEDNSIDSLLELKTNAMTNEDKTIKNVSEASHTRRPQDPNPSPNNIAVEQSSLRPWKAQPPQPQHVPVMPQQLPVMPQQLPVMPQGSLPYRFRPMLESISEADSNYYSLMEFDRIYENWQLNQEPSVNNCVNNNSSNSNIGSINTSANTNRIDLNSRIASPSIQQSQQNPQFQQQQHQWANTPSPMIAMQMQSQYYVPNVHFSPSPLPNITNQLNLLAYEDEEVDSGVGGRGSSYLEPSSSQDEHFSNFRPFNAPPNVYPNSISLAGSTGTTTVGSPLLDSDPNFFLRNNYYHYNSPSSSDTEGTSQNHNQHLGQMDRNSSNNNNRRPRSGGSRGQNYNRNSSAFVNAERQLSYDDYRKLGAIPKGYAYSSSSDSHEERRFSAGGSGGSGGGFADFSGSCRQNSSRRPDENAQRFNESLFEAPGQGEFSSGENTLAAGKLLRKLEWAIAHGEHRLAATLAHDLALLKVNCKVAKPNKDPIMIRIYVEDRFMQQGPFLVQVMQAMTLKDLKCKIETDWGIPSGFQKWILGKRMAEDDHETLLSYEVVHDTMAFLYLVTPQIETSRPISNQQVNKSVIYKEPHPTPPPLPSKPANSIATSTISSSNSDNVNNNHDSMNPNESSLNPSELRKGRVSVPKDSPVTVPSEKKSNSPKICDNDKQKQNVTAAAGLQVVNKSASSPIGNSDNKHSNAEDFQNEKLEVKFHKKSDLCTAASNSSGVSKEVRNHSDVEDSLIKSQPTPKPRSRTSSASRDTSETLLNLRKIKEQEKVDLISVNGLKSDEVASSDTSKTSKEKAQNASTSFSRPSNPITNITSPNSNTEKQKSTSSSNKNLLSLQQKLANLRHAAEQAFGKSFGQQGQNLEKKEAVASNIQPENSSLTQIKNNVGNMNSGTVPSVKNSIPNQTNAKVDPPSSENINVNHVRTEKTNAVKNKKTPSTDTSSKDAVQQRSLNSNPTVSQQQPSKQSSSQTDRSSTKSRLENKQVAQQTKSASTNTTTQDKSLTTDLKSESDKTHATPPASIKNLVKESDLPGPSLVLESQLENSAEPVVDTGEPKPTPRIKKQLSENAESVPPGELRVDDKMQPSTSFSMEQSEKDVRKLDVGQTGKTLGKSDGYCQTTLAFPPPKAPPKQITTMGSQESKNDTVSSSQDNKMPKTQINLTQTSSPVNLIPMSKSPSPTNQNSVNKSPSGNQMMTKSPSPTNQIVLQKSPSPTNSSSQTRNISHPNASSVITNGMQKATTSSPSQQNNATPNLSLSHQTGLVKSPSPVNSSIVTKGPSPVNQQISTSTAAANHNLSNQPIATLKQGNSSIANLPSSQPNSFNKSPTPFIAPSTNTNTQTTTSEVDQSLSLSSATIQKPLPQKAAPGTSGASALGANQNKVESDVPVIQKVLPPTSTSTTITNKTVILPTGPQPHQPLTKLSNQGSAFVNSTRSNPPSSIIYKSPFFLNSSPQKALNSSFNSGISGIISQFPSSSPLRNAFPSPTDTRKISNNGPTSSTPETNANEKWPTLQRKNSDSSVINMVIDSTEGAESSRSENGKAGAGNTVDGAAALIADDKKEDNVQTYLKMLQLMEKQDLITTAEEIECPVCFLQVPPGDGVTLRDCLHNFCKECLIGAVQYAEDSQVKCPFRDNSYSCNSTLQEREIKALVPGEVFEKYLARSVKLAEHKMMNTFHCKTNDCTGWCIFEDDVNVFKCPVCNKRNCLTCAAIHENIDCQQYQRELAIAAETDENAKSSRLMLEKMIQRGEALECPACHVVLLKKWGCDWVRCSYCKTEICWITKGFRWGPGGKGDNSGGCKCGVNGIRCHPKCTYCH